MARNQRPAPGDEPEFPVNFRAPFRPLEARFAGGWTNNCTQRPETAGDCPSIAGARRIFAPEEPRACAAGFANMYADGEANARIGKTPPLPPVSEASELLQRRISRGPRTRCPAGEKGKLDNSPAIHPGHKTAPRHSGPGLRTSGPTNPTDILGAHRWRASTVAPRCPPASPVLAGDDLEEGQLRDTPRPPRQGLRRPQEVRFPEAPPPGAKLRQHHGRGCTLVDLIQATDT